jgi:predicted SAM-dependent methyltransferase
LPTGEVEEEAVNEEVFLDDQVQQEIYEEAFLEELDYHEMVFAMDEALDELREEAAGCKLSETMDAMYGSIGYGVVYVKILARG